MGWRPRGPHLSRLRCRVIDRPLTNRRSAWFSYGSLLMFPNAITRVVLVISAVVIPAEVRVM